MSQENVEVVRRTWEAFMRGDESYLHEFEVSVEWTTAEDEPDPQTYRGIEGVRTLARTLFGELWERDFEILSIEYIDAEPFVIVPFRALVKARLSGVELEAEETHVYELRGGKVVRVREYRTKREALEAAGLSE
jgi:ketosteroid isomerase-like protein